MKSVSVDSYVYLSRVSLKIRLNWNKHTSRRNAFRTHFYSFYCVCQIIARMPERTREKPERGHVAVCRETIFLASTVALTGFILEPGTTWSNLLFCDMVKRPIGAYPY